MQTSSMLTEFGVPNMIIDSKVKEVDINDSHMCYVAMVETLNNRLQEKTVEFDNLGLVIIDEAHYNSFRKLFKYLEKQFLLGVTATPLSSNIKLPMKDNYNELICGSSINFLVSSGFLAKATTYTYDVGLGSLKVGINGDYTVKSSEMVYGNVLMQSKLLYAYKERSLGQKTLIFNNGINTSKQVFITFKEAGFDNVRHLDSKMSKTERNEIVEWFRKTDDAVLTSVGILTTGFDEPSIRTSIMNSGKNTNLRSAQNNSITKDEITDKIEEGVSEIVVFPNPANHLLNIKGLNGQSYNVYSITGQKIIESSSQETIDLMPFQIGAYLIRTNDGKIIRFIKYKPPY